jgi:hypothetical protein
MFDPLTKVKMEIALRSVFLEDKEVLPRTVAETRTVLACEFRGPC